MSANREPIFPNTFKTSWGTVATANTAKDGTGTVVTIITADAAPTGSGLKVDTIKVRASGTNVATVMRFFINNGGANSTPTNNVLFHEQTIAATTLSEVASLADTWLNFNGTDLPQLILPPGYKINVTIGTAVAAGLQVTATGGELTLVP